MHTFVSPRGHTEARNCTHTCVLFGSFPPCGLLVHIYLSSSVFLSLDGFYGCGEERVSVPSRSQPKRYPTMCLCCGSLSHTTCHSLVQAVGKRTGDNWTGPWGLNPLEWLVLATPEVAQGLLCVPTSFQELC